jgi:hypothetical protein
VTMCMKMPALRQNRSSISPTGVRGRKSDNRLICEKLDWSPSAALVDGLRLTYQWVRLQTMGSVRPNGNALPVSGVVSNAEPEAAPLE